MRNGFCHSVLSNTYVLLKKCSAKFFGEFIINLIVPIAV